MSDLPRILNAIWATAITMSLLASSAIAVGLVMYTASTAVGQPRLWALAALFCLLFVLSSFLLAFTFNVGRDAWIMMASK